MNWFERHLTMTYVFLCLPFLFAMMVGMAIARELDLPLRTLPFTIAAILAMEGFILWTLQYKEGSRLWLVVPLVPFFGFLLIFMLFTNPDQEWYADEVEDGLA